MAKYTSDIDYVQYALDISYDDRYYYAHCSDPFAFSCSTLVGHSLYMTGYVTKDPRPADGHAIGGSVLDGFLKEAGFVRYTWANSGGLKPGDALIVQPYHVAWHVKNGIMVAANGNGDMVDHSPTAITTYDYRLVGTPQYVWRPTKIHKKSTYYEFDFRTIKYGNKNKSVKLLQALLKGRGYKDNVLNKLPDVDGAWGDSTQRAFEAFQKKNGLAVKTYCDEARWRKLLWR